MNGDIVECMFAWSKSLIDASNIDDLHQQQEKRVTFHCMIPFLQLSLLLSGVTSFESFCRLDADDVFLRAPNSTWNYKDWMARLCSVQVDQLLKELNQTVLVDQFSNIVSAECGLIWSESVCHHVNVEVK